MENPDIVLVCANERRDELLVKRQRSGVLLEAIVINAHPEHNNRTRAQFVLSIKDAEVLIDYLTTVVAGPLGKLAIAAAKEEQGNG